MNKRIAIKYTNNSNIYKVKYYKRTTFLFLAISIFCISYIFISKYSILTNSNSNKKEIRIEKKLIRRFFNESMHMGKSHPIDSIGKMLSISLFQNIISKFDNTVLDSTNSDTYTHQVEKNQTLYSVAQKNKVTVESIIKLNNLKNNNIKNGTLLKIRKSKNPVGFYGIDVSEWQSKINWKEVQSDSLNKKLKFYIIKATQGIEIVDENYEYNWTNAKNSNSNIGAYHFYIFKDNPILQANNYIKNVKLQNGNILPIIDIEYNCSSCSSLGMPSAQFLKNLNIFLNQIQKHFKCKPIIYSDLSFYNQYLKKNFSNYPIWIAKYDTTPPLGLFSSDSNAINNNIDMWQFSCNERIKGISGKVDISFIPFKKYNHIIYNNINQK